MNLILFKNLNLKNKMRVVNLISQYYPYEDINNIYNYFLVELETYDANYIITSVNKRIYGIGLDKTSETYLYWPILPLDKKYFGNHAAASYFCSEEYKNNFKLFLSKIISNGTIYYAFLSTYGIENIFGDIFENAFNFKKRLSSKEEYWGGGATFLQNIREDNLNYKNVTEELRTVRDNPREEIYVYTNRIH